MYRTVVKTAFSHSLCVSKFKLGHLLAGKFNTTLNPSFYMYKGNHTIYLKAWF